MKVLVRFKDGMMSPDAGDIIEIQGFVNDACGRPCAIFIKDNLFQLISIWNIEAIDL